MIADRSGRKADELRGATVGIGKFSRDTTGGLILDYKCSSARDKPKKRDGRDPDSDRPLRDRPARSSSAVRRTSART